MGRVVTIAAATLLLALGAGAPADEGLHRAAAIRFYEASKLDEPAAVGELVAGMIVKLQPGLEAHRDILSEYALELVTSERYRDAQVRVYMEMFTADELDSLAQMFTTRVFSKYRRLRVPLVRRTTEATIELFRDSLPELERRIRARAGAGASRSN